MWLWLRRWAFTRYGKIFLLGGVCVLLHEVHIHYRLQLGSQFYSGELIQLHVGALLAIALLVHERGVFFTCALISATAQALYAYRLGHSALSISIEFIYLMLGYGWLALCAQSMGWQRVTMQKTLSAHDLYRFVLLAMVLVPLGQALLALIALQFQPESLLISQAKAIQLFFAHFFAIIVITLPVLVGWTERHRPPIIGYLHCPLLPLLGALALGSVWLVRHWGNQAHSVLLLTDYRIALLAVLAWCILYLRWALAMALLSAALFLMVYHAGSITVTGQPVDVFRLLHRALETSIFLIVLMHYAILSRNQADMNRQLMQQSQRNALTGLPNVRALRNKAAMMPSGTLACLLLDRSHTLSIGYGIDAQVGILNTVAGRIRAHGVEPYQLSNTEFALLAIDGTPNWNKLLHSIEKLRFGLTQQPVSLLPYLGVAQFGTHSDLDMEAALVLACSLAMEACHRHEVQPLHADNLINTVQQVQRSIHNTSLTLASLRRRDGLVLYFQPIMPLLEPVEENPRAISGEVLCRLQDNSGKLLGPNQFLPIIEAAGRGPELDLAVVSALFSQLRQAPELTARCSRISVNLTSQSLAPESFGQRLLELLDYAPVPLSCLCFEITETIAFYNAKHAGKLLGHLRERGCKIAIDDFGVGMQSFARLKELPIDIIKIDGSFVRNLTREHLDYAMVQASVSIARACRAEVVAEYVENEATAQALRRLGVHWGQGYLYAKPMPLLDGLRSMQSKSAKSAD